MSKDNPVLTIHKSGANAIVGNMADLYAVASAAGRTGKSRAAGGPAFQVVSDPIVHVLGARLGHTPHTLIDPFNHCGQTGSAS